MNATLWLLLTAAGFGLLRAISHTGHRLTQAVLVRAAAFSFAGAGVIGAAGWLGGATTRAVEAVTGAAGEVGTAAVGTAAVVWVVVAGLAIAWVLTMLPTSWFNVDPPDWLSISGLLLPPLLASVPGPVGNGLTAVFTAAGGLMTEAVRSAFGM